MATHYLRRSPALLVPFMAASLPFTTAVPRAAHATLTPFSEQLARSRVSGGVPP